jgi:hypothetical protein
MIEKLKLKDIKRVKKIDTYKKNKLREIIRTRGYDYGRGLVVVSKDNKIIDGNHRYQACLELYGKNAFMKVKKIKVTYFLNFFISGLTALLIYYLWN